MKKSKEAPVVMSMGGMDVLVADAPRRRRAKESPKGRIPRTATRRDERDGDDTPQDPKLAFKLVAVFLIPLALLMAWGAFAS
jgi:hypothetical protein